MRYKPLVAIALLITFYGCASLGDKSPVAEFERDAVSDSQPDCEAQKVVQEKSLEEAYAENSSGAKNVADAGL